MAGSYHRDKRHAGYPECEYLKPAVVPRSRWRECSPGGEKPAPAWCPPSLRQSSSHCSDSKLGLIMLRPGAELKNVFTCVSWPSKPLTLCDVAQTSSFAIVSVDSHLDVSDHLSLLEGYELDFLCVITVDSVEIAWICGCMQPGLALIISYVDWEILGSPVVFVRVMKVFQVKTIDFLDATEINHQRGSLAGLVIRNKPIVLL